jgi:predicted Zn-dependent protease with MMP-like domain
MWPIQRPDLDDIIEGLVATPSTVCPRLPRSAGSVATSSKPKRPDQLGSVGVRGLYGLYQGVPRTAYGADQAAVPSKITLFRGPLTRAARTPEALARQVTETVYHEIAHHFGISDARLHELRRPLNVTTR